MGWEGAWQKPDWGEIGWPTWWLMSTVESCAGRCCRTWASCMVLAEIHVHRMCGKGEYNSISISSVGRSTARTFPWKHVLAVCGWDVYRPVGVTMIYMMMRGAEQQAFNLRPHFWIW